MARSTGPSFLHKEYMYTSFIENAEAYNKNSSSQWELAMATIKNYPWKGDERVLDVGCGDGKITAFLSDTLTHAPVIGLDLSPSMIKYATEHFPSSDYPRLFFMQGDGTKLPFHDQFDLVVSFLALQWILDQEAVLKCIWNSLKEGGKALLLLPSVSPFNMSPACVKLCKTKHWALYFPDFKPHRVYFTKEEYEKLLTAAGFSSFQVIVSPSQTVFASMEALYSFLRPVAPFIAHLSQELQDRFITELAVIMLNGKVPAEDGSILVEGRKLEVIAEK
jgi:trans-aconitate 2-methyltransferase